MLKISQTVSNINFGAKLVEEYSGSEEARSPMLAIAVSKSDELRLKGEKNAPELSQKYESFIKFLNGDVGKSMLETLPKDDELVLEKTYSVSDSGEFKPVFEDVFISYNSGKVNDKLEYEINTPGTFDRFWNKPGELLLYIKYLLKK